MRVHARPVLLGLCLCAGGVDAVAQPASAAPAVSGGTAAPPPAAPAPPAAPEPKLGFEPDELAGGAPSASAADGLSGVWALLLKATVGLAAVLMLVYLTLGKGLGKLALRQGAGRSMRVVDRVGLDPKKTLYLVDVDGVRTLVGVSDNAMSMMVLPDAAPPAPAAVKADAPPPPSPSHPESTKGDA